MSPENIVNTGIKTVKESAEIAIPPLKHLIVPLLRAFTWGLDELIRKFDMPIPMRQVTQFMRAQMAPKRELNHAYGN